MLSSWDKLRRPKAKWPLILSGTFLALCGLGVGVGYWLRPGRWGRPPNVAAALFRWDAIWYWRIAHIGYRWSPRFPNHYYDVAFFPLWSIVDAAVGHLVGGFSPIALIIPSLLLGLLSIFAFYRLAVRLLPEQVVPLATAGYALYPGASFFVNSYPVAILNLLLILMLIALLKGRTWRAAALAGVATAAGPLAVTMALAVPLSALDRAMRAGRLRWGLPSRGSLRSLLLVIGAALASVSGILAFMAYQVVSADSGRK